MTPGILKSRHALIATGLILSIGFFAASRKSIESAKSSGDPDLNSRAEKQRGVSWVGGRHPGDSADFEALVASNVNWIVQTPFGWQSDYDSPEFQMKTGGGVLWGETDQGIRHTTLLARKRGIKTMLKPHIWLRNRHDGKWRSDIEMHSEKDWQSWFAHYRQFIVHYAMLADTLGIEALCIGTELHQTTRQRENDWREIIKAVREVYNGKLIYAANWYKEFEEIKFWDALDYIGIQAYFPLTSEENPEVEDLIKGWDTHLKKIEKLHKQTGKPVAFTEVGYRSMSDAAIEPWKWPERGAEQNASNLDLRTQKNCYQALFQTFWDKPWFAGCYIWKWFPNSGRGDGAKGFSPQNKPAQVVLAEWYGLAIF